MTDLRVVHTTGGTERDRFEQPGGPPYCVWAPHATRAALSVDGRECVMLRGAGGWWTADRRMRDGELYGYLIDGDGPFPDPRSAFQPFGVHGLSECVDHAAFRWSDGGWQAPPLGSAVIYELHVGTFSEEGTFAGAIDRLPYLADIGVTHIELMPVAEFPGRRGWGYDGVDLFAPHHAYGRPEDLKRLVDACHAHGLAVLLDVVYNHFGPSGNYLRRFGPYFTDRYRTPWGEAVNLDGAGSDEVRRFFCDNAAMWLREYHMDGLRLDAVHALIDTSAVHFLEQLAAEVDVLEATLGRHLVLIAETDLNDPRIVRSRDAGGYGIDAQWNDDFHHALHALVTGERSGYYSDFGTTEHLATSLRQAFVYAGSHSPYRGRVHGRTVDRTAGWRFVVSAQNHDQIGNRALGERLCHLTTTDRVKVAAAVLVCAPFVPLLFQGEEWCASTPFQYFTAHDDDELAAQVSEGRRREFAAFGWEPANVPDPQALETFERSCLRWSERDEPEHRAIVDWYRALIALRREHASLRDGHHDGVRVIVDEHRRHLVIRRGELLVACNLSDQDSIVATDGQARVLLSSSAAVRVDGDTLHLPADSVAIVRAARLTTLP